MIITLPLGRKVYHAWNDAKRRCYDPAMPNFKHYGLQGIGMQDSWLNDVRLFYKYVSNLPDFGKNMTLDRVDNTEGYHEGNLRWTSQKQQVRNQGVQENNSSGVTGISFCINEKGVTSVRARWNTLEGGKSLSKSFSVPSYGLLPAFKLACEHRVRMINQLNLQGAGYSEKHGK